METSKGSWRGNSVTLVKQAVMSGTLSSILSIVMLAVRGKRDAGTAVGPLNAPSHWLFGKEALRADGLSWRHTLTGLVIHQASSMLWGLMYDQIFRKKNKRNGVGGLAAGAIGLTAAAALVDLKMVPSRLTPGFEHRLSRKSLVLTYGAFAAGLAITGILLSRRR